MRLLECKVCERRISPKWLFLALPWSSCTCTRCGSVLAVTSAAVFILGYVLIRVLKWQTDALVLVPAIGVTAAVFLLDLPHQTGTVDTGGGPDVP